MEEETKNQIIKKDPKSGRILPERDAHGRLKKGFSGNLAGKPVESRETKAIRRATKELMASYKEKLAEALPEISPVLIAKAIQGDLGSIKEVHDRVFGKPNQSTEITGNAMPYQIIVEELEEKTNSENNQ